MPKVLDQLREITVFCYERSIDPQAIEACEYLGLHIRVSPADFDRLQLLNATQSVFGGDNPWLLRAGYIDGIEVRCHQSVEPELAKSALGDRGYITAVSFDNRFTTASTATCNLSANQEANHA